MIQDPAHPVRDEILGMIVCWKLGDKLKLKIKTIPKPGKSGLFPIAYPSSLSFQELFANPWIILRPFFPFSFPSHSLHEVSCQTHPISQKHKQTPNRI